MERRTAGEFDQGLLNLFDQYVHGDIDRRGFLERAAKRRAERHGRGACRAPPLAAGDLSSALRLS